MQDQFDAAVQENIDEFDMEVRSLNAPGHHLNMRAPALTLPVSVQREEAVSNALEELKLQVA